MHAHAIDAEVSIAQDANAILPSALPRNWVYAYGQIRAYFPSLSVEREFYQALLAEKKSPDREFDIHDQAGLLELNQAGNLSSSLSEVLKNPRNASIAREMCWTLQTTSGTDLFLIEPADETQLLELAQALLPENHALAGWESTATAPAGCKAWNLPRVQYSHLFVPYVQSLLKPPTASSRAGAGVVVVTVGSQPAGDDPPQAVVQEVLQLADNAGRGEASRAINYLLLNSASLYSLVAQLYRAQYMLAGVRTAPFEQGLRAGCTQVVFDFASAADNTRQAWFYVVDTAGVYPFVAVEARRFIARN